MGKYIIKDILRDNNFRYFFRIKPRLQKVGLVNVLKEGILYYKRFSRFPSLIDNQEPDFKYKLFVFYNYFKIIAVHPEIEVNHLMGYLPTRLQRYFLYNFDPKKFRIYTFDKIKFYKLLDELYLPYPKVFFYTEGENKFRINGEGFNFGSDELPDKFFVKPIRDNGGENAGVYNKSMIKNIKGDLLAQELATNHSDLIILAGNYAFNTVRIITFLDKYSNVEILSAILRLSTGKQVDNWGKGSINIDINIETGKLGKFGITKYFKKFERHPAGQVNFENYNIPYWEDLLELVHKGCIGLSFLKLIAWDIGISQNGPLIIEANSGCDLFHAQLFKPYLDTILVKELTDE